MKSVTKILTVLLAMALVLPLAACAGGNTSTGGANVDFTVATGGEPACTVVFPGGENTATWKALANDLTRVIKRATGVTLSVTADTAEKNGNEILLGPTNRTESETALAKLSAGNSGNAFSISVTDGALVIAAATTGALSLAISYFEAQYNGTLGATVSEGAMVLPKALAFTYAPAASAAEPGQLLSSTTLLKFVSAEFAEYPANDGYSTVSATAVANGVLYTVLSDGAGNAKLVSTDLTTGKRLATSDSLSLGGADSMCYNALLGLLAVAGGGTNTVTLIDPATLTVRRTVNAGVAIRNLTYDAQNLRYIAQKEQEPEHYVILNNSLSLTSDDEITVATPAAYGFTDYTLADACADSEYLYLLYETKTSVLLISQSRTAATRRYCNALPMDGTATPLSLTSDGRTFYITTAGGQDQAGVTWRVQMENATAASEPSGLFNETNTADADSAFLSVEKLFEVYSFISSEYSRNTVMQGACTDGTYGYFFQEYQGGEDANDNSNYENSETHDTVIVKVDMATGDLVKYSEPLKLGHSNDGCYNPHTGQLIVAYNGDTRTLIKFIDPETLEITGEKYLSVQIFSIAYNEVTRQYIVGRSGGRNFAILDESFKVVKEVSTDYSGTDHKDIIYDYKLGYSYESDSKNDPTWRLLTQGIDCDSKYVYFVLSGQQGQNAGRWVDYLLAFDYEGNHVFTKELPTLTLEIENIFHIGKDIYITCNGKLNGSRSPCYRLTVFS